MAWYRIAENVLDAIANAINAKTGHTAPMTPVEMVSEIQSIPVGVETFWNGLGVPYFEDMVIPEQVSNCTTVYKSCVNMKTLSGAATFTTSAPPYQFQSCSNLKTVNLPKCTYIYAGAFFDCNSIENFTVGSVGNPVAVFRNNVFNTSNPFLITLFVNAQTLAEATAQTNVGANAPFNAANATIIYKSSVTGEVLV